MNDDLTSHGWHVAVLTLLALVVIAMLLLVQNLPPGNLNIWPQSAPNEDQSSAVLVDPLAGVHPADRKFFTGLYTANRNQAIYSAAGVHPADRKFSSSIYRGAAGAGSYAVTTVHAADRKFFGAPYTVTGVTDPLERIHPADRKFFDPAHCWTASGCSTGD